MEEALKQLVESCTSVERRQLLSSELIARFCEEHLIDAKAFSYNFARLVALEFADGLLSFRQADAAMNRLSGAEGVWGRSEFAEDIYEAFDAGEYVHDGDPPSTISWQKYTLPAVMGALANEGLLPRA